MWYGGCCAPAPYRCDFDAAVPVWLLVVADAAAADDNDDGAVAGRACCWVGCDDLVTWGAGLVLGS